MIYRALTNLEAGKGKKYPKGALFTEQEIPASTVEVLIGLGKVARVSPPPLSELPGWKRRAKRLEKHGILDAGQFLEMTAADVAAVFRVEESTAGHWKEEVTGWLTVSPQPSHG